MKIIWAIALALLVTAVILLYHRESFWSPAMPILVISIPGSKRREHMKELLKDYPGKIQFMDGIIVTDDATKRYHMKQLDLPESLETIRGGDLGCALAHIYTYKYIIDHGLERVLILEDDVDVTVPNALDEIADYTHPKTEMEPHLIWLHPQDSFGTQAQLVSQEGAQVLYEHRARLLARQIDMAIWGHDVPVMYVRGPVLFKHQFEFNDFATSERMQLNETK